MIHRIATADSPIYKSGITMSLYRRPKRSHEDTNISQPNNYEEWLKTQSTTTQKSIHGEVDEILADIYRKNRFLLRGEVWFSIENSVDKKGSF